MVEATKNINELSDHISNLLKSGEVVGKDSILLNDLSHTSFLLLRSTWNVNIPHHHRLEFAQVLFPEDALPAAISFRCQLCKEKAGLATYWSLVEGALVRVCDMPEKEHILLLNSMIRSMGIVADAA